MSVFKSIVASTILAISTFSGSAHANEFCQRFYKIDGGMVADLKITHFQMELKRIPREGEEDVVIGGALIPVNAATHAFFINTPSETQICVQGHFSTTGGGRSFHVYEARLK